LTTEELRAYAAVVLEVGLRLRPGQDLAINGLIEHAPFARVLCEEAYARGAELVDIWYWDPHSKAARLRHAPAETLGRVPSWLDARYDDLAARDGALINLVGDPEPDLLADVDPARAGLDRMPGLASRFAVQSRGEVEWTFAAYPTDAWAARVLGQPDADALWRVLRSVMRLDEPDPVAAWQTRMRDLAERCAQLNALRFDALRFRGPGTDLTVGMTARHRWGTAEVVSRSGVQHVVNLPTEEIFTTPDPARAEGVVRATLPLALSGSLIEGLQLRFAAGRIVEVSATTGAEVARGHIASDPGAARLGEVALVDSSSRVRQSGLTFYETLLDENASCHLAWGNGIPTGHLDFDPRQPRSAEELGINASATHTDFMIGGPDVTVYGVDARGEQRLLLEGEEWRL
jgi:aminopeptidase